MWGEILIILTLLCFTGIPIFFICLSYENKRPNSPDPSKCPIAC
jgi:hypothetical protein